LDNRDLRTPYLHPDVFATLVVSQDNLGYLSHTFPLHRFVRIHYGIDGDLFTPLRSKRAVIAFMPRKNAAEALQVFNILKFRGLLSGFELVAIQRQSEREVAKLLGESLFFFSFGYPEGCPLPPMEAMSCGCVVVGYHGWGGREYFREEFSYPVEPGDVVTFARRAEQAILDWQKAPDSLRNKGTKAWRFIGEHYSPKREEQDIVSFWRTVLDQQS
jgi:glycosyltransferase involved in cell wall biosynthesis